MKRIFQSLLLLAAFIVAACSNDDSTLILYRIQVDGKFGFIDSLGNVVIEPQYKYVSGFSKDGYAFVVSKEKMNSKDSTLVLEYGYIDKSNKLVVDTTNWLSISIVEEMQQNHHFIDYLQGKRLLSFTEELYTYLTMNCDRFVFQDNKSKLFGYKDRNGKIIIPAKYDYAGSFNMQRAIVRIQKDSDDLVEKYNSHQIIDSVGKPINTNNYYIAWDYGYDRKTWVATLGIEEGFYNVRWTQIDVNGKTLITAKIMDDYEWFSPDVRIYNNQYSDVYCIFIGKSYFDDIFLGDEWSLIGKDGHYTSTKYDEETQRLYFTTVPDITSFSEGYAGVMQLYDEKNNEFYGGSSLGDKNTDPAVWYFVDKKLEKRSVSYDSIHAFREGLAAVKELTSTSNGRSHIGKWGYLNNKLKMVIPFTFDEVGSFKDGLAYFKNKGQMYDTEGYINKKGKIVWQTKRKEDNNN